jgi:8-oxo-dGTP diphosphatase
MIERFNIRVYGLLIDNGRVLVCDEERHGQRFTKFPGGALEFGEGMRDALVREWMEETRTRIDVTEHVYTTDFFQPSMFDKRDQLIAVYFKVKLLEPFNAVMSDTEHDYVATNPEAISWRWLRLGEHAADALTFPIDKLVAAMLQ